MARQIGFILVAGLVLSACTAPGGTVGNVPEAVATLAGPNQNLATARVLPEDGCYWYNSIIFTKPRTNEKRAHKEKFTVRSRVFPDYFPPETLQL